MSSIFLAGLGRQLLRFEVDVEAATLERRDTLLLPEGLQYLWPHPVGPWLYAACSNARPHEPADRHAVCALRVDSAGRVLPHGDVVTLDKRPVHVSVDRTGRWLFLTSSTPTAIAVHRLHDDGTIGAAVAQPDLPALPKIAHQMLATPDNARVLVPLRGNDATPTKAEDPGALMVFDFDAAAGTLALAQTIAPDGGIGFGPRHVDFVRGSDWLAMSIERQNQVATFRLGPPVEGPFHRTTTLERPDDERPRQLVGAIHAHPDGRTVYVSNRADGTVEVDGHAVFNGAENTIAVYRIDGETGRPEPLQKIDTRGMHARTFSIDPTGRLLVAANMTTRDVRENGIVRRASGGLSVFRIENDGRLAFLRSVALDTSHDHLFWAGFVPGS